MKLTRVLAYVAALAAVFTLAIMVDMFAINHSHPAPSKSMVHNPAAPAGIVPMQLPKDGDGRDIPAEQNPLMVPNRITKAEAPEAPIIPKDRAPRSIPPLAPGLSPKVQHGYVNPPKESAPVNPYLIAAGIALCVVMVTAALYWIARVFLWPSHKDDRPNNHPEQPAHTGTNERPFL